MEKKALICIGCPMGCSLSVEIEEGKVLSITGNTCPRGESYAEKEVTNPTRIVTTTVKVKGGRQDMVSVKTKTDIPKDQIFNCVRALKDIEVLAPVEIGDIILENVADTGANIVATRKVASV